MIFILSMDWNREITHAAPGPCMNLSVMDGMVGEISYGMAVIHVPLFGTVMVLVGIATCPGPGMIHRALLVGATAGAAPPHCGDAPAAAPPPCGGALAAELVAL